MPRVRKYFDDVKERYAMYSQIQVVEGTASIHVYSGLGAGPHVKLIGATFPVVPYGTVVEKLSVNIPDGLHAIAFFCKVKGPHERGSGKTRYLDPDDRISCSVLLSWVEGDKVILKADSEMSAGELAKFNPFVRADADVQVVDPERKVAYASDRMLRGNGDGTWTLKSVSVEAILLYITKKLTLEDLDQRAIKEQKMRDTLDGIERDISIEIDKMKAKTKRLEKDNCFLQERCERALAARNQLTNMLMKSERLYKLLKRLPTQLRPRMFNGFLEAMDSFNGPATS